MDHVTFHLWAQTYRTILCCLWLTLETFKAFSQYFTFSILSYSQFMLFWQIEGNNTVPVLWPLIQYKVTVQKYISLIKGQLKMIHICHRCPIQVGLFCLFVVSLYKNRVPRRWVGWQKNSFLNCSQNSCKTFVINMVAIKRKERNNAFWKCIIWRYFVVKK